MKQKKSKSANTPLQHKSNAKMSQPPWLRYMHWIVFAFAFLLYVNSITNEYALDDDIYCLKNKFVQAKTGGWKEIFTKGSLYGFNGQTDSQYRVWPLINFKLEISWFGNKPHTHHFFNVLLYAFCCMMLYLLLKKIFANRHWSFAVAIALLFTAHPIHTDVVANIKSRDELWSFFWGFLSFNLLMLYVQRNKLWIFMASVFAYFIATISKESSLPFVVFFPLILFFFTQLPIKKIIMYSVPYFVVVIMYWLIRTSVLDNATISGEIIVMNNALMAAKDNPATQWASKFVILYKYILLLIFPKNLSWDYSYNAIPIMGWNNFQPILSLLLHVGMGVYAVVRFIKKDLIAFAILFYLITLAPVANFFVFLNTTMAERLVFTPSLGFVIIAAILIYKLLRTDPVNLQPGKLSGVMGVLAVILLLYTVKTISRNPDWKNNISLFSTGIETNPGSARVWLAYSSEVKQMGTRYMDSVNIPALVNRKNEFNSKAVAAYEKSVTLAEKGLSIYDDIQMINETGFTLYQLNKYDEAIKYFKRAIKLKPNYSGALNNIGVVFFGRKNYDSASVYFKKAIEADSLFSDGYSNLGASMHNKNLYKEAIPLYQKALKLNPGNANAKNNLITIFKNLGDTASLRKYSQ